MKHLIKYKAFYILTVIGIILSYYFHETETVRRGYRTIGGEFTFLFIGVLWLILKQSIQGYKEVQRYDY